jgi:hypothetical protein
LTAGVPTNARAPSHLIVKLSRVHVPMMNTTIQATLPVLPDYYPTNYNHRCLLDVDGNYCLFHLQSTNSQDECDACGLRMFQTELSNSYFYNDDLAEQYSSFF